MFSESWQLPNKLKAAVKHTFFDMNISGWLNAEALVLLFFSFSLRLVPKVQESKHF